MLTGFGIATASSEPSSATERGVYVRCGWELGPAMGLYPLEFRDRCGVACALRVPRTRMQPCDLPDLQPTMAPIARTKGKVL